MHREEHCEQVPVSVIRLPGCTVSPTTSVPATNSRGFWKPLPNGKDPNTATPAGQGMATSGEDAVVCTMSLVAVNADTDADNAAPAASAEVEVTVPAAQTGLACECAAACRDSGLFKAARHPLALGAAFLQAVLD